MPLPFPINPSVLPTIPTRKALLILDLQNAFVSSEGALYAGEPDGFVDRILELAKAFRDSAAGDVIWVRSEYERHCSLLEDDDQIITADTMLRPQKAGPSRGRQPTSTVHDTAAMEADEEAFLSNGSDGGNKPCVRKGTRGAEFAPEVKAAIAPGRDLIFTKTHYSAFAPGQQQLVQLLRGRFVTQLYVCGALTNISIYATALGAGQHAYDVTLVEDCCGFRKTMRHLNAMRQLMHLAGCEVVSAEMLLEQLQPAPQQQQSTGLSPVISKISLHLGGGARDNSPAAAPWSTAAPPQSGPGDRSQATSPRLATSDQSSAKGGAQRPLNDTGRLEAESDPTSSDGESTRSSKRKSGEAQGNAAPATAARGELESSKGPIPTPAARSAKAEKPRINNPVRQRVQRAPVQDKRASAPASTQNIPVQTKAPRVASEQPKPESPVNITATTAQAEVDWPSKNMADQPAPVCSPPLCEGDTTIITDVLPPALAADAFERLLEEVSWAGMSHMGGEVPRRIAVQGAVAVDGSMPVYRHPADESPPLLPFSSTVLQIKEEVEKHLGHPLNHVLIQHYRTGNDYISEHSDKTLDVVPDSFIANVSLGAERTMVFRTKRPPKDASTTTTTTTTTTDQQPPEPPTTTAPTATAIDAHRQTTRAALPHNSLCRMGLRTNARWTHAIRQDKRADRDKSAPELSHAGARISLTFRRIGTFIDAEQAHIWGQGATVKTQDGAKGVVNGQTEEAVRLLRAFGAENNRAEFEWKEWYGQGFDVLHMGTPKRFCATTGLGTSLTSEEGGIANVRVALALAELGVGCARGSIEGRAVRFEDNDPARTVVEGHVEVLRYLDAVYGAGRRCDQMLPGEVARRVVRLQRGLDLLGKWRAALQEAGVSPGQGGDGELKASKEQTKIVSQGLRKEVDDWEGWAREAAAATSAASADPTSSTATKTVSETETGSAAPNSSFYIAGGTQPSPADFALWPVLHDMVRVCGTDVLGQHLGRYYAAFKTRSAAAKALGVLDSE